MCWLWKALQIVARIGAVALLQMRVYGRGNVPRNGGILLASNHQSYLDPILVGIAVDRELNFMARRSLFKNFLFRSLITIFNAFPIERNYPDIKGVKETIERLKSGKAILVFPEGTRTKDGKIGKIKAGISMIAEHACVPIIPVLIQGAYEMWPRRRFLPFINKITIIFGKPIRVKDIELTNFPNVLYDAINGLKSVRCKPR